RPIAMRLLNVWPRNWRNCSGRANLARRRNPRPRRSACASKRNVYIASANKADQKSNLTRNEVAPGLDYGRGFNSPSILRRNPEAADLEDKVAEIARFQDPTGVALKMNRMGARRDGDRS